MAVALTYSSLLSNLENYLQRHDDLVVSQLPYFILWAQQRIARELKILGLRTEITGTFSGGTLTTGLMAKPADWRKTAAFYIGTGVDNNTHVSLFERMYEYLRTNFPDPTDTGQPQFYADADYQHWFIAPTPASGLPYKIVYFQIPPLLDDSTQTNWLTNYAPDLLLYASLLEAVPFVKSDERIPVWQSMYAQAKAALQGQDLEGMLDQTAVSAEPQPGSTAVR